MYGAKPRCGSEAIEMYCRSCNPQLCSRPEFYSGYGPSDDNCGPAHLQAIYEGLRQDFGQEVATNFCRMVESLTNLSATNFLEQFDDFFRRKDAPWQGLTLEEDNVSAGPDLPGRDAVCFATVALGFRERNPAQDRRKSESIKARFFRAVGYTPTAK